MRTSRQYLVGGLLLSLAWMLAGGCGASSGGSTGRPGGNEAGMGTGGADDVPTIFAPDTDEDGGGALVRLNPLCGVGTAAGTCVPDNATACSTFMPPAEAGGGGAGGEGNVDTGTSGEGGQAGAHGGAGNTTGAGGEGGQAIATGAGGVGESGGASGEVGGASGATGAAGLGGDGGIATPAAYSCQVTREANELARRCVTAGSGATNAPCFTAADCAAGLACVTEGDAGRCLPYCCDPASACASGAYCAERPLRKNPSDTSRVEPPHVPVCVPADNCSLEERFPCPAGSDCRCKNDTACMVVKNDGTTTCLEPGTGEQGAACPCAWNHVCSTVTNTCIKICHTDPTKNECGVQKCQASSELPKNFGVCVGPL